MFRRFALVLLALSALPTAARAASSRSQADAIISATVDKVSAQRDVYWHDGDYPRIIALARILTELDPHFLDCYETGGWLMESLSPRYYPDAEAYYQMGVRNNPDTSEPYYHLAAFYFQTVKDYSAAAAVMQKAVRLPDTDLNDFRMLAHSYEKLARFDLAVQTWRAAEKKWPKMGQIDHDTLLQNLNRDLAKMRAGEAAPNR